MPHSLSGCWTVIAQKANALSLRCKNQDAALSIQLIFGCLDFH